MKEGLYVDPEMQSVLDRMNANPITLSHVEDTTIEGAFGPRKARIYDAGGVRQDAPGLIYFHGGGWIFGDLDSEDSKLRYIAQASRVRIVSIDYVLSPEHQYPKPLDDCIASTADSRRLFSEGYGMTADMMEFFYSQYSTNPEQRSDPQDTRAIRSCAAFQVGLSTKFSNQDFDTVLIESLPVVFC